MRISPGSGITSRCTPTPTRRTGHGGDTHLADIHAISGADDPDPARNELSPVAAR